MSRVRYSRAEALKEATDRAAAFVARRADEWDWRYRYISTSPAHVEPPRRSSKHPVVWAVMFAPIPPPGSVIDGGELLVIVDLEQDTVSVCDF